MRTSALRNAFETALQTEDRIAATLFSIVIACFSVASVPFAAQAARAIDHPSCVTLGNYLTAPLCAPPIVPVGWCVVLAAAIVFRSRFLLLAMGVKPHPFAHIASTQPHPASVASRLLISAFRKWILLALALEAAAAGLLYLYASAVL